ncbi:MAG: hypothetical protein D6732_16615 [Methanobacteriota archaeon]|nr:MAG: hypothetical protein D6732_16615 [Euryarchaeota archaeon]
MSDELLLIEGISQKRYCKLIEAEIETIDQFLDTPIDDLIKILGMENDPSSIEGLLLRARLFKKRQLLVKKPISLPDPKQAIFFDIEASATHHNVFLVSFYKIDGSKPVTIYNGKRNVFESRIVSFLSSHPTYTFISSSGNHFDKKYLIKTLKRKNLWTPTLNTIKFLDLMQYLKPRLITPVGFSVKKLSHLFGYPDYEHQLHEDSLIKSLMKKLRINPKNDSIGYLFALAYERKILNGDIWAKMIEYNVYDVMALSFIYSRLYGLVDGTKPDEVVNF